MKHGDIRPCFILQDLNVSKNNWRMSENLRDKASRGQQLAFDAGVATYVSPLAYKNLFENERKVEHDLHKSDVFSFGLCLLESGVLKSIQHIYDPTDQAINYKIMQDLIDEFCEKYSSEELHKILRVCLLLEEKNRPDWVELRKEFCSSHKNRSPMDNISSKIYFLINRCLQIG